MHFDSEMCIKLKLLHPTLSTRRSVALFIPMAEEAFATCFDFFCKV